jgi:hypothetical protein
VTRAQFIQQAVLDICRLREFDAESTFDDAAFVADMLETSGIAPWDGASGISAEGAIVRGYAEGANDARKHEREACAQIAAGYGAYAGALDATRAANEIAAEIRARGSK